MTAPASAQAAVFRAIADPHRRTMLDALRHGERSVAALSEGFTISQPAVSQHLQVLREAGLVRVRKAGRQRFYSLDPGPLRAVSDWLSHYETFWDDRLDALERHLARRRN